MSKDDDRIELRFNEITKLNKSLQEIFKINKNRSNFSIIDFQQTTYDEIKNPNQLIEEVERNILSGTKIEHPQDTDHLTYLNTTEEIFADARAECELKNKISQAMGEQDTKVSKELVQTVRKELVEPLLGAEGEIATDVIQNLTDIRISDIKNIDKNEKKDVEKHIKETIKKDNANLLPEIIIEEVQDNREIAIPSSSSSSST